MRKCFLPGGYPSAEMWEMPNIEWEPNGTVEKPRFRGGWAFMDPYALHNILADSVYTQANWILRSGVISLILEQLVMLELFGGCTLNIHELKVTAEVYAGLNQVTKAWQRDNVISPATLVKPPRGYPYSTLPFPAQVLTVSDKTRNKLKELRGAQEATSLAHLAQRMMDRWIRRPAALVTTDRDRETEIASGNRDEGAASLKKKRKTETVYRAQDSTSGESSQETSVPVRTLQFSRPSSSQARYEPAMDEVSKQLQATALHSEESEREDRGSDKEKFNLRVTLAPRVTRSQVERALEESKLDTERKETDQEVGMTLEDDDDEDQFPDPASGCLRSLEAATESAILIKEQVQRGRARERALRQQL
eukprot:GHVR01175475.1.p1 GENE.GHVR01175475.1~~GHVR01175475.1.p1  ORF type:complete len:364 (+),score=47.64 GHVR01175475.1:900-1991(+)